MISAEIYYFSVIQTRWWVAVCCAAAGSVTRWRFNTSSCLHYTYCTPSLATFKV